MLAFLGLMIPLSALALPIIIVFIVFWYKNERDQRRSEIINNGMEKGYTLEEIKQLLDNRE